MNQQSDTVLDETDQQSRYIVGIDLGTTNSALCYIDTSDPDGKATPFLIPQLIAAGETDTRETLPSFHYEVAKQEFSLESLKLPWKTENPRQTVGLFAREQGMLVPGRVVGSAKSWLSHSGVDRSAELLPWHGAEDVERLSPVTVSARYLKHLHESWNHRFPIHPLSEQDLVITLPASFDEVARELTVKAARLAGLPRVVLIEEPQAAFYAWIDNHSSNWDQFVTPGQRILICDIGGGTSDFTLIHVRKESAKQVQFHRVAVGEHLILGGDNLDLALAHHFEKKLSGEKKLQPRQWDVLVRTCRYVKETFLGEDPPETLTINLPGSGSSLIAGSIQIEASRQEVIDLVLKGFFPSVPLDAKPVQQQSGFREFGLPYASDPAMTKHLAQFLSLHRYSGSHLWENADRSPEAEDDPARPDIILFNGGMFASPLLQQQLLKVLESWFPSTSQQSWSPLVLENERLDLAVAQGAAYFGMVRRGAGVRINAGLARSYYLGIQDQQNEKQTQAVCLVPAGVEPGEELALEEQMMELCVSEPVEFPLYVSSTRLTDQPGELLEVDRDQMTSLPPIRTVLKSGKKRDTEHVKVVLHVQLTEIGTLEIWCQELKGKRRWKLQFDIRSTTQTDRLAHQSDSEQEGILDEELIAQAEALVRETFIPTSETADALKPSKLAKSLGRTLKMSRKDWPSSLLRSLWHTLMECENGRGKSPNHEARWLNLLGFSLRPGFGFAMDDWRVLETWKVLQGKLLHGTPNCRSEWWILWRRIAGGLTSGQQQSLAEPLMSALRGQHRKQQGRKQKSLSGINLQEQAEKFRFLGSLELLSISTKTKLGKLLLDMIDHPADDALRASMLWTLGRIGSRVPMYGPLNGVLPADAITKWVQKLLQSDWNEPILPLTFMQLSRKTDDRYRDLPLEMRKRVVQRLEELNGSPHIIELVEQGGTLESEEQNQIFGESLPIGLRLGT